MIPLRHLLTITLGLLFAAAPASRLSAQEAPPAETIIETITFDVDDGKLYAPLQEAADTLGWLVTCDPAARTLLVNGVVVEKNLRRQLLDGTELISGEGLTAAGAQVNLHPSGQSATVIAGERQFTLLRAEKRVEVSLGEQRLRAWQGGRLVLETNISSGRNGRTPAGNFRAGPFKSRMHRSSRYHNAPMPWSVQINGHIFIHGFTSVPSYPASHGCVRMPLNKGNPARFFYEWVDRGTPVVVTPVPPKPKKSRTSSTASSR